MSLIFIYLFNLKGLLIFRFITELLKVKDKANSKGDLKELASCCNVLGELFQQQGKYEDAILEHEAIGLMIHYFKNFD